MQSVIFQATKEFLKFELHALSSVTYSDQLYLEDGGSYRKKRIDPKQIQRFISRIKEHYPEAFEGISRYAAEESPWDDDMYISIQFNILDDGFHIYMD